MGCSTSKLDDKEAVRLCKDRKKFIREAISHRMKLASGHIAYIQAMQRVSAALQDYIDGDEPHEFLLDSFTTQAFDPVKKPKPRRIAISSSTFSVTPYKTEATSSYKAHRYIFDGYRSVSVEERPPRSPDTYRVDAYPPAQHFTMDSIFGLQSSPYNRPNYPPPSPRTSQWDFFWNPFSSLDYYGYTTRSNLDPALLDDDNEGLQQVREEEGIPELEEETEYEEVDERMDKDDDASKFDSDSDKEEGVVEDVNESDDSDINDETDEGGPETEEHTPDFPSQEHENKEVAKSQEHENKEVAKSQNVGQVSKKETAVADSAPKEETPGFTVYVNRRPMSMTEVIKDLQEYFATACNAATAMSSILEASRVQYSSSSNDHTAMKMLNPVALFRSSSRSSSSRFLVDASTLRDDGHDLSEKPYTSSGSHQSTLDRLYIWEKKLYQDVRAEERFRMAYEKKCAQLRDQDVKGHDPSFVDKTQAALRDLNTKLNVSIHSVEAVSKRIETLRDKELEPQLLELVQGLARMWKVMAECHTLQRRTLDEAKTSLTGAPSKLSKTTKYVTTSPSEPHRLVHSTANLESELRNWRTCFNNWIVSQRSYVHALEGWLMSFIRSDPKSSKTLFSPSRTIGAPPIFNICVQWSRLLDAIGEAPVLDGLEYFAAGIGSLYAQQKSRDNSHPMPGSRRYVGKHMEMVEAGHFEDEVISAEKMAEVAIKVVCAGMSVAVGALAEFAVSSAEGYGDLIKQCENGK